MKSALPLLLGATTGLILGTWVGIRRNPLRHARAAAMSGVVSVLAIGWIVVLLVGNQLESLWPIALPATVAFGLIVAAGIFLITRRRRGASG